MAKESAMQKQVKKDEKGKMPVGKTPPLLDVGPKKSKEIVKVARAYNAKVKERLAIQNGKNGEVELQQKLLDLVKAEKLQRDNEGKIKFTVDGVEMELVPTKEKVKVKIIDD